jgi:hypothetical protein
LISATNAPLPEARSFPLGIASPVLGVERAAWREHAPAPTYATEPVPEDYTRLILIVGPPSSGTVTPTLQQFRGRDAFVDAAMFQGLE